MSNGQHGLGLPIAKGESADLFVPTEAEFMCAQALAGYLHLTLVCMVSGGDGCTGGRKGEQECHCP